MINVNRLLRISVIVLDIGLSSSSFSQLCFKYSSSSILNLGLVSLSPEI